MYLDHAADLADIPPGTIPDIITGPAGTVEIFTAERPTGWTVAARLSDRNGNQRVLLREEANSPQALDVWQEAAHRIATMYARGTAT